MNWNFWKTQNEGKRPSRDESSKNRKYKSTKREVIEWTFILGFFVLLYSTGLHKDLSVLINRVILATGLMNPSTENNEGQSESLNTYDFEIQSIEGNQVSFTEFKGKTIFLNKWATWCGPCVAEMPSIQALYDKIGDEVAFVMLSTDRSQNALKSFIQQKGYTFPVYQSIEALPSELVTRSIPTTFVISRNGKIIGKHTGATNYNTEKFKNFLLEL